MKFEAIPTLVFISLCVDAALVLKYSSSSKRLNLSQISSSPLHSSSLINTIILAILVGYYRPSANKVDNGGVFPFIHSLYGTYDGVSDDGYDNSDVDTEDYNGDYASDGYVEDDDDNNGSDGEVGSSDDDDDEDLEKRIEDFIAKVNNAWKEEKLRDNLHNDHLWLG